MARICHILFLLVVLGAATAAADPLTDGLTAYQQKQWTVALIHFRQAQAANLGADQAAYGVIASLGKLGRHGEAITEARAWLRRMHGSASRAHTLAQVQFEGSDDAGARQTYDVALRRHPGDAGLANGAAWFFATTPSATARDPGRAVRLATFACERSGWKSADRLDTLAAAQAAGGDFSRAVETQRRALALAADNKRLSDEDRARMRERLGLYGARVPWRERPKP